MDHLRAFLKAVLPLRIRYLVRGVHRKFVFGRAMGQFLRDPSACRQPGNRVLRDLVYGWGNESWSALDEYLAACIMHALSVRGPILECGSGLSTILIGVIAKQRGLHHFALEHTSSWAKKVDRYLTKYQLESTVLCVKPLADYGDFSWYDPPLEAMPEHFSLVICDGPPSTTQGGRIGLGRVMGKWLTPGCTILLDDAEREQESAIAKIWESQLGASYKLHGAVKPYIEMTIKPGRPCETRSSADATGFGALARSGI